MQLKEAGLTAYNHNLDTSREFYPQVNLEDYNRVQTAKQLTRTVLFVLQVITTRSYDDRLRTIANVREAGLSVCSGGILGLGEVSRDAM
jgi:biotin synthase